MSKRICRPGKSSSANENGIGIKRARDDNWRDTRTSAQCLSFLYLSEYLSDISFTFSTDSSVKLPAHKFVLCMRSTVFETMFYGALPERGETVLIKDVEPDVMKVVLQYIYSDTPPIDGNNVLPCLYTAKKYDLPGLVRQCSNYLENNIDVNNVCPVYEQAAMYEMKPLQDKCLQFIIENDTRVLSSPGFLKLSHATLQNVLKMDKLEADEIEIFKAALKWAEYQCEANKQSVNGQNVRNQLGKALFQIRFPIMPIREFARVVTPSKVLTNEEIVMLYQYNTIEGSTPLGKFIKQERSGKQVIVDFSKYPKSEKRMSDIHTTLHLERDFSQQQSRTKSVKIKGITGTFVQKVNTINVRGTKMTDYETYGNRIIFKEPVGICDDLVIDFHFHIKQSEIRQDNITASSDGIMEILRKNRKTIEKADIKNKEKIKGQMIIIKTIPAGLETIVFV